MNSVNPNQISTEKRLEEAANIFSTGIMRYLEKKRKTEKISLDKSPTIRPYGGKSTSGENHE